MWTFLWGNVTYNEQTNAFYPGARDGAYCFVDFKGDFYLFGGM